MQQPLRMGYVSRHKRRDLSRYETVYEDPEYERLKAFEGPPREERITAGMLTGGSTLELVGGLVAAILAIVGFTQQPIQMAGFATIAIGVALLSQGVSIMTRWRQAVRKLEGAHVGKGELIEGVSTEVFGGIVGIVLGIVALSGVRPATLLAVAAVVFGGSLLLGGTTQPDLAYLAPERNPRIARATFTAIQASGGVMVLVGIAAAVLGVLALVEVGEPVSLVLVALLAIGFALLVAGGALTTRFVRRFT